MILFPFSLYSFLGNGDNHVPFLVLHERLEPEHSFETHPVPKSRDRVGHEPIALRPQHGLASSILGRADDGRLAGIGMPRIGFENR
jgi:hypothetical protein